MKILSRHGWPSIPGGMKPSYPARHCQDVMNPAIDDDDRDEAVRTALADYDSDRPGVSVGSSREGPSP